MLEAVDWPEQYSFALNSFISDYLSHFGVAQNVEFFKKLSHPGGPFPISGTWKGTWKVFTPYKQTHMIHDGFVRVHVPFKNRDPLRMLTVYKISKIWATLSCRVEYPVETASTASFHRQERRRWISQWGQAVRSIEHPNWTYQRDWYFFKNTHLLSKKPFHSFFLFFEVFHFWNILFWNFFLEKNQSWSLSKPRVN